MKNRFPAPPPQPEDSAKGSARHSAKDSAKHSVAQPMPSEDLDCLLRAISTRLRQAAHAGLSSKVDAAGPQQHICRAALDEQSLPHIALACAAALESLHEGLTQACQQRKLLEQQLEQQLEPQLAPQLEPQLAPQFAQENAQLAQARETANQALPLALDEVLTDLPNRCNPSARLHQELHALALSQPGLVRPGIGIAMYPGDGHTPACVTHSADTAMYLSARTHASVAFHEQRASS